MFGFFFSSSFLHPLLTSGFTTVLCTVWNQHTLTQTHSTVQTDMHYTLLCTFFTMHPSNHTHTHLFSQSVSLAAPSLSSLFSSPQASVVMETDLCSVVWRCWSATAPYGTTSVYAARPAAMSPSQRLYPPLPQNPSPPSGLKWQLHQPPAFSVQASPPSIPSKPSPPHILLLPSTPGPLLILLPLQHQHIFSLQLYQAPLE